MRSAGPRDSFGSGGASCHPRTRSIRSTGRGIERLMMVLLAYGGGSGNGNGHHPSRADTNRARQSGDR
jgi:hypothetical protein